MIPLFAYFIKSSVSLAVFYCLFRFVMRNDRNHTLNRFLLLGILIVSAMIPFLNIQLFYEEVQVVPVEFIREFVSPPVIAEMATAETVQSIPETTASSINPWLAIYFVIMATLLSRLFIAVFQVTRMIKKAEKQRFQKIVLAVVKEIIQPFTFLNKVVLSEKDFTENKDIVVAHEHAHIKQMHAIDLMLCELCTAVQFFNPFMWLLRRDLKLIHEYQADEAVLNKGIDAQKYQLLVLEKAVGERRFAMANHFRQKPIFKRIKMMQKKKIEKLSGLKIILFVPLAVLLLMAFSKPGEEIIENTKVLNKITATSNSESDRTEYGAFFIEVKKEANYIENKVCSINELVAKAKTYQKTGREDILLVLDNGISLKRVDEIRLAFSKAKLYHVNQTTVNSDEIIYPHGDVSKLAKYQQGSWREWWESQLKEHLPEGPGDKEYRITYGFVIDKNGKVSDGHVMEGCQYPEINEAYSKVLASIPDWKPAVKGQNVVSVYCKYMDVSRIDNSSEE